MKKLLKNGIIITKDANDSVFDRGWILLNESFIEKIGSGDSFESISTTADIVVDLNGNIVLPGLINSHTHFSQTLLKGFSENLVLQDWLEKIIRPLQDNITIDEMSLATQLTIAENLHYGVTTVVQHHKIPRPEFADTVLSVAKDSGIRMGFMLGCNDKISSYHKGIDSLISFLFLKKNEYDKNFFSFGFGPTSLRNCSKELFSAISNASSEFSIPIHIHIAETENERNQSLNKYGLPPIKAIDSLGLLNKWTQLVHCVWIDDSEIELIKNYGCHIIYCPVSNLFLRSGFSKIDKMLNNGTLVAIGSDGSASSVSQNIFDNLKLSSFLLKLSTIKPTYSSASTSLYMATRWAARILGRDDIGHLVSGAKADIVVINTNNIRHQPIYDPQVTVVFNTSSCDISLVIVDGKVLLENGRLTRIDEEKLIQKARHYFVGKNRSTEHQLSEVLDSQQNRGRLRH